MGSDVKRWEDEASMEGLGLIQDLIGVPNNAKMTKGELALHLAERTALAGEQIASQLPRHDIQTVFVERKNDTEAVERVSRSITSALEQYSQDASFDRWHHDQELQKSADKLMAAIAYIYNSSANIEDGIDEVNDQLGCIDDRLGNIDSSLQSFNEEQIRQSRYLIDIITVLKNGHADTKSLLKALAKLIVKQTRAETLGRNQSQQMVREMFETAIKTVVGILFLLQERLLTVESRLDGMADTLDNIRDIAQATQDSINHQTETMVDLAGRSLELKAGQYMNQGKRLLSAGLPKEAVNVLTKATESDQSSCPAHLLLAQAYAQSGNASQAKYHFSVAEKLAETVEEKVTAMSGLNNGQPPHQKLKSLLKQYLDDPSFQGLPTTTLPIFMPVLREMVDIAQLPQLPTNSAWWAVRTLLGNQNDIQQARQILMWLYKNDSQIMNLARNKKYPEISFIFKRMLGASASQVKRFGEIPMEIRHLL